MSANEADDMPGDDMSPAVAKAMEKFEQALAWRRHVEAMIAHASLDPRDAEIRMLRQALSECGQRRLSTEADNRRLREALGVQSTAKGEGE